MKTTAQAPANIAFIKYWGVSDPAFRIPQNNSISMNLTEMFSTTTVEFDPQLSHDDVSFVSETIIKPHEIARIVKVLDRVRSAMGQDAFARVQTKNSFPKSAGIASSASGFAALSLAALTSAGIKQSEKELSVFARLASGTACRSIPDGFVEWEKGTNSETSFAYQLHPPDWWDICDIVVIVNKDMKKVSSTQGHTLALTSPFYKIREQMMPEKIQNIKRFLKEKNFTKFGELIEEEALNMHAICTTSTPALIYWEPATVSIMKSIVTWRERGDFESYFTIDAGPSVHVLCQQKYAEKLQKKLIGVEGVVQAVINYPGKGVHLVKEHLF